MLFRIGKEPLTLLSFSSMVRRREHACLFLAAIALTLTIGAGHVMGAVDGSPIPIQGQGSGKAPKPHIGSAMAVLATLEQAQVLPPENTPEANRVIKSVIQFQSAFTKSGDPRIQDFAARALAMKYGEQSTDLLSQVRTSGWTAPLLEALAEAERQSTVDDRRMLGPAFAQFNLSPDDFHLFMELLREAQQALAARGLTFAEVYASNRQSMPGANAMR